MKPDSSRREFLALAGSGLFVFFRSQPAQALQEPSQLPGAFAYPADFNAYLRIGANGRVTCFSGKVEYGQGITTSLAQLLAEELDIAFESVDMVMGDTNLCPPDMGTFGSLTIRQFGPALRGAGAEARAVLLQMAAERLNTLLADLEVHNGIVMDRATGKQVTYAHLVEGRRIERHVSRAPLKPVSAFRVIGQPQQRKDAEEKITGKAKFTGDIVLPGMLYARILRPPAHGAVLSDFDTKAAEAFDGARVVKDGDLIAVLHQRPDLADKAFRLVKAHYKLTPPAVDEITIFGHLVSAAPSPQVVGESGSLAEGEKLSTAFVEETYLNSYVAHAPIETHSAVAMIENGKITVWASTQTPFPVQKQVAQALGAPLQNVRIITPYIGGAFGGKSASQQAIEAARLAKAAGKPVQVVFDRAEEFFYDAFRPAAVVKIRAGVTAAGKIALWNYHVFGAGDREAKPFYEIPHQRTVSAGGWQDLPGLHPFAVGPWRAPAVNTNTFARESHIDILARRAGLDPLEFRLNNLSDPRMRRALEAVAPQFGWRASRGPGHGKGVACGIYSGTYVATMAEVSVDRKSGVVRVQRVVSAVDQGLVVNPDGARQQIEGSITMGLGYALAEELHFRGGEILDRNFDTYEIPRFSWLPKIETVLVENPGLPSQGCGEPPIITMGAVIANAIFDAVGIRLRQLPMTPVRVLAALQG